MVLKKLIDEYKMPAEALKVVQATRLLLIASIVGGGKDTVVNELMKTGDYHRIVTNTTRKPRINHGIMETNSKEYYFVDNSTAEDLLRKEAFIEAKYVHGNVYGTTIAEVQAAHDEGKIAVTDIDVQGVVEYLNVKHDTHAIFLLPPSVDTWINRLNNRYGNIDDHKEEITKRFRTAYDEITHILEDKRFVVIINDDLETTVERVRGVVTGEISHTSGYAEKIAEHLLDYLKTKI